MKRKKKLVVAGKITIRPNTETCKRVTADFRALARDWNRDRRREIPDFVEL